jgi:hypothetical protein
MLSWQLKNAYHKLMDEKQRNVVIMNIEFVEKETRKERKRLLNKGVRKNNIIYYMPYPLLFATAFHSLCFCISAGRREHIASIGGGNCESHSQTFCR